MADLKHYTKLITSSKYEDFILELRRDPIEYISSNKLTEEDILQCISKIIVTGEIEIAHRLQLLIALQENSSPLLTSDERLEVAVSNLCNYCEQLKSTRDNFFKSQVLVTITIMLLNYDSVTETFASLLSRHCDQLWHLFEAVNDKDNCLVREIAAECLLEIEESFPCIFLGKLEEMSNVCFKESHYPFQNFSNLISLVLKHVATVLTDSRTNEVLVMMKELPLIDDINQYRSHSRINMIATKLLDIMPLLSPPSIQYAISNIVHLMKILKLNPLILKTFINRHMQTSNAILFNLLLRLKDAYQNDLFSNSEQDAMITLLIDKCNPVSTTETNCMLALSYVGQYFDAQKINFSENKSVIKSMFYLPKPLDSLQVKENKLELFSKLIPFFKDKEWHNREFLDSIIGICSQLLTDDRGHYIVALCRILYCSTLSQNEPVLEAEYQRISLSVISDHPHLSMHVFNLIKKIKLSTQNPLFFSYVLSTSLHRITCLPVIPNQRQLDHYLLFLAEAALENSEYVRPKAIMRFLQKIVNENCRTFPQKSNWMIGHSLLNVYKNVLCSHNSNNIYADLGNVLLTLISQSNDIDVRDRAQFYYMLLTTLSPKKITVMFQQNVQKSKTRSAFTNFVPGDTTYGIPTPVLHLSQPILCLTRIPNPEQKESICDNDKQVDIDGYYQWLIESGYSWKTSLRCRLSIASHAESMYCDIYGIILSFVGPSFCSEIPHVSISNLARDKPHTFTLEVEALESRQMLISSSAIFSAMNGQTCCSKLHPLILDFHDLFHPLPVPSCHVAIAESWRKNLASNLWDKFTSVLNNKGPCDFHQSIISLQLGENFYLQLLNKELKDFITERTPSCSEMIVTVGIFLPRKSHLIMKIRSPVNERLIVHMATDNQHVSAQVNLYLCKLEKKYLQVSND